MTAVQEVPEGHALVSAEIYITDDPAKSIVVAGDPERATRFAVRLARVFEVPAPAPDKVLQLYVTRAEFAAQIIPVLQRFSDLKWGPLEEAMKHHPDNQDKLPYDVTSPLTSDLMEVFVSERLSKALDERGFSEGDFTEAVEEQIRGYDIADNQTLVFGMEASLGKLAFFVDMPNRQVRACFYDEPDWEEIKRNGIHLGEGQSRASINSQMRQLQQLH
jgi:hypothetical protein